MISLTVMSPMDNIVFASDCFPCELCGEPVCPKCQEHYAECPCRGPHSEDDE